MAAHGGVAFPMSDVLAQLDLERAVTDRSFAWKEAAGVVAAVALASELAHDAREAPEVAAGPSIPADEAIDRFRTDAQGTVLFADPSDLLSAIPAPEQLAHAGHLGRAEACLAARGATARSSVAAGLPRALAAIVVGHVAPQLATDRARASLQLPGDLGVGRATHEQGGNPESFFSGKLVVQKHDRNLVPGRIRVDQYYRSPPYCWTCCTYFVNLRCQTWPW